MSSPSIATATPSEQQRVIATFVMAFSSDPIARWVWPEPDRYLTYFPEFVPLFGGKAFEHGTAYCADGFAAASLWLPPGVHSDEEAMGESLQRSVAEGDQEKVFAFFEQMGVYHPTEPHWYLPIIGVDTVHQGRGYGSALLMHALQNCDRDKLPAYLEASNEGSRRLYLRHGFEQIGEIQAGDSPPAWPMLRQPR